MSLDADARQTDDALLARFASGDGAAARDLAGRHAPRILALARRMLRDGAEAEDVTQETMLRMWRMAPDWRSGKAALGTWLYRVASNLCIDRMRRRRETSGGGEALETADASPGAFEGLAARDRTAALDAALEELPDRQRVAVVLRHIEERSNPEIAEIMGVSVEAVESLIGRGKRALAARLAPRKEELGYDAE